jgi:hypothetical protein
MPKHRVFALDCVVGALPRASAALFDSFLMFMVSSVLLSDLIVLSR